jgi:hypothetical protein
MAPIILLRISRTLILQSVVRVLSFRKRPSETHSGPGLETPTDAVTFVRLQHQVRSRPDQRASRRGLFFCYKYFSCCLAQRILCEVSFVSFSSLLPPYQLLSLYRNKASSDNASSKGPPTSHTTNTRLAWSCSCSKERRVILPSSRQSTLQRQRALGMSPTLDLQTYMHSSVRNKLLGVLVAMDSHTYKTCRKAPTGLFNLIDPVGLSEAASPSISHPR